MNIKQIAYNLYNIGKVSVKDDAEQIDIQIKAISKHIDRKLIEARIEEHEQLKYSSCPHIDSAERLAQLKKELQRGKE